MAHEREFKPKRLKNNETVGAVIGPIWLIGWLFTLGYAQLVWWQAILALVLWPYFLGGAVTGG